MDPSLGISPPDTTFKAPLHHPGTKSRRSSTSPGALVTQGSTSKIGNEKKEKGKKKSRLLSFLGLKEPSQAAFDQLKALQRRQGATIDGRSVWSNSAGEPIQKLPPAVPRVNSKWDGMPQPTKPESLHLQKSRVTGERKGSFVSDSISKSPIESNVTVKLAGSKTRDSHLCGVSSTTNMPLSSSQPHKGPDPLATMSLPEMTCFFPESSALAHESQALASSSTCNMSGK